ncbi:hypothetical protein FB45DRAFT_979296 [Roridomyces roridus]|uniref:F-box domain-containing protein n=1 Tax=Roridomyces roridus TaxID=1738132 RepID=A0AAD7BUV9_9AGAR|nr:hypothetical protein FB45DRAFT_979296 [Roridomyces roridus]
MAILDSPEVVQKLLDAILESPNGKRAVSRLARTCRAWKEPALDALWRELDSLVPIIGLFPSHLLKKTRRPGLGLTTPPAEGDWDAILKYANRITKITYDEISNNVSASIFPVLEENRPRKYILPNLRHLVWRVTSPENLDRAYLFLNPELQGLTVHLGIAGMRFPSLPALLADVGSRMKLRSFSLTYSVALPESLPALLNSQDELERVSIVAPGTLAASLGKWLAYLPRLKSLQLDLSSKSTVAVDGFFSQVLRSGASTPNSVEFHTDSGIFSGDEAVDFTEIRKSLLKLTGDREGKKAGVFSALTQVQLTGQALNVAAFLTQLPNALTNLEIVIEDPPNPVDWQHLSHTICERFGGSLLSLRIGATLSSKFGDLVRSTSRGGTAAPPSRLSLEYLSFLPALRTLSIDLPESIIFLDADIAHLAANCPSLEEVRLCPLARFSTATPPQLSLEGLAPLMKDCPRLNTLAVVINAKAGSAELSASSKSLNWFHVGHSWVADTLQVAILLSQLAPHLETIRWFTERNRPGFVEANARSWQKVSDILPHMQNLRLTERRAAAVVPEKEVVIEYVHVEAPRPTMCDKAIDATVCLVDRAVEAKPSVTELAVQVVPSTNEQSVEALPETTERETQTSPLHVSIAVDATPPTAETEVDATPVEKISSSVAVQAPAEHAITPASLLSLFGLLCRFCLSYPLSLSLRLLHASFGFLQRVRTPDVVPTREDVPLDTLNVRS